MKTVKIDIDKNAGKPGKGSKGGGGTAQVGPTDTGHFGTGLDDPAYQDEGSSGDEETSTNPASGCQNCPKGDWWCEVMKFGCEGQAWAGNGLPMIAIGIGAVLVVLIALR